MMQLLPTEKLDWVNPKDFNLNKYSNDIPIGYFLKVYLDYPDELYDLRKDYPLAGANIKVTAEMLSKYQLQIIEDNDFCTGRGKKTIPNLGKKNSIAKT